MSRVCRVLRSTKQINPRLVRPFSKEVTAEISDAEKAAGHGRTTPWHYTVPHDWKDTRSELHKAQHRGEIPDYDKNKGPIRKPGRAEELEPNVEELRKKVNALLDEDGIFQNPHCKEFASMSFQDTFVNYHFDYIGLKSPLFGDGEIEEIESKTSLTRDNIHNARDQWINLDADMIDMDSIMLDIHEMFKKGVKFRTINMYLDYISGSGTSYTDSIRNTNWTRIDS